MAAFGHDQPMKLDFRTVGRSGARFVSGYDLDDIEVQLQGTRGSQIYREMQQDATCGSVLYTIDTIARQAKWRVERASDHPRDREAADFLDECREDMDMPWTEVISEALSMVQFGFAPLEVIYKRRCGDAPEPFMRSRYRDGRIGWRGMPLRAQETIQRWLMDEMGNIVALDQLAAPTYVSTIIPMEKVLLFRTSSHKNVPTGRSVLRSAWRAWRMKRAVENIEGVGIERDLAGLPVALVPPEVLAQETPEDQAMYQSIKTIITNIRRDESEGVIFPSATGDNGQPLYELKLLTSGGSRNFDVDRVIARYDARIAACALADFLLLGQGQGGTGSWAMHSDKSKLFCLSLNAHLDTIAAVLNRHAVERLFKYNTFTVDEYPRIVHEDVESVDLKTLGEFIQNVSAAGAPLFPNEELERRLCEVANLPPPAPAGHGEPLKEPVGTPPPEAITEVHDGDPEPAPMQVNQAAGTAVRPNLVPTPAATGRV